MANILHYPSRRKGVILIEVLVAVSVMTLALTMMVQSLLSSVRADDFCRKYLQAGFLMDNAIFPFIVRSSPIIPSTVKAQSPGKIDDELYRVSTISAPLRGMAEDLTEVVSAVHWPAGRQDRELLVSVFLPLKKEDLP